MTLKVGDKAPDISVLASNGATVSLKDFAGKKVVLYFYPKDNTPGCTREACGFRDHYSELEQAGAVVLGVSKDSIKSHEKFISNYELPFLLLSDQEAQVASAFGAWGEKRQYGRTYMGMFRMTFLIDEEGKIAKVWPKVKPDEHATEVLAAISES